jgi:hypothetical protein
MPTSCINQVPRRPWISIRQLASIWNTVVLYSLGCTRVSELKIQASNHASNRAPTFRKLEHKLGHKIGVGCQIDRQLDIQLVPQLDPQLTARLPIANCRLPSP